MEESDKGKLNLVELIALVVGSIIGGGVFNLMHDMSAGAGAGAIIIGWVITAIGMLMLAKTFQNLTMKRPDLDAGVYSYAEAGFGKYMGFNSAWGYWLSAWLGNVGYATLLMSAVGYFFPVFGDGQNIWSIVAASFILWACHFMILRGVESASFVNTIITIAKLIPIFIFLVTMIIAFRLGVFTHGFWYTPTGTFQFGNVMGQVRNTMLVTVWVFIGIEGAVVFSGRAKNRKDVGRATVLGIITVILIYALITLLSLGVMQRAGLAKLTQPAMADLLQSVVGKWGAVVVNAGLIISVVGAWLSWTMFAGQLPYEAAKEGTFPKIFAKENKNGAPVNSLLFTNICVEVFMFSYLVTASAYNFFYSIASAAILIPYAFSAFYQFKYSIQESPEVPGRGGNITVGAIASIYALWLLFAANLGYILLMSLLFAVGIPVYILLQKRDNKAEKVFGNTERIIAIVVFLIAVLTVFELFRLGVDGVTGLTWSQFNQLF
ncbi:arginine-ornithine antiporter [Secundilactobacillus paracollinoides]|uniref:Arginine-ornithine antiporter n=1 Tax=Secundilactobacillus paracollinoides TaxID=240427 RepID=A0A1B2J074_9LACO|nr:arginine-ornithine antiporter [Secundilactobacillus paracollinoides]ANZ61786.1 arginine-ornithine antiporter [Secundilactobacillus paracollinoides]ANZ67705.1 arginine-ornithine antiporter [Secundilactobacillus paracollinoides]KRL75816.1 arginine ornithine antiporter [Secundilactobacillus paracollinoides DSM 15502 = JCM 11969]